MKEPTKKPLSDEQLAVKYDNKVPVDFDAALLKMAKADSLTSKNKNRKNNSPISR